MVSIYMNGVDKTTQMNDWRIDYNDQYKSLNLICYFESGKFYTQPLSKCEVIPTELLKGNLLTLNGQSTVKIIEKAINYGNKYTVIYYPNCKKPDIKSTETVQIIPETNLKNEAVFNYFKKVIDARVEFARDKSIAENIQRQFNNILSHPDMVLHAYCTRTNQKRQPPKNLIYPFGINESQLIAVEQAFSSQISVIEGPPGTGKTQTILNIIANILINNKTVAILSNNNSAVENVYEKLAKVELDYLVAKLGSSDKRSVFFDNASFETNDQHVNPVHLDTISEQVHKLKSFLTTKNQIAIFQAEIEELTIEKNYLQKWQGENQVTQLESFKQYALDDKNIIDLLVYLDYLAQRRIYLKDRIELFFNFKILRTKFINDFKKRNALFYTLQLAYYDQQLEKKNALVKEYEQLLEQHEFKKLLAILTNNSMDFLKSHLQKNIAHNVTFTAHNYKKHFADFIKRYPIIGSSSHSIINSIGHGSQIDYLIIDEASQQDIIPALLGLSCAKNVIIVGDRKQLPHIPEKLSIKPPTEYFDCEKYSLLDSVIRLFQDQVPVTLLKEHYRCHPKIIQFCNKQFYDNQLIPMINDKDKDKDKDALILITTALGNHTRNFSNLRELDSLNKICQEELNQDNTGFIAPYNKQIDLSQAHLPEEVIKATIHKFQGRECDNIVFSTVLDKKWSSQRNLSFVDDPCLVNVAVSRAKNKFILVTGNNVFTKNNQSIAALIRYMKYYAKSDQIYDSPVISAFDLLYNEYDKSLETLKLRLNPKDSKFVSEQIVAELLRHILRKDEYKDIIFHREVRLEQLVKVKKSTFDEAEQTYIRNKARCDFVVYYNIGKAPLCVIEVDGGCHDKPEQQRRDRLKNAILAKVDIPLLRIKTIDSHIYTKIKMKIIQSRHNTHYQGKNIIQ